MTRDPVAGGGARVDRLSREDLTRMQNAADRTGLLIALVGSRAGVPQGQCQTMIMC